MILLWFSSLLRAVDSSTWVRSPKTTLSTLAFVPSSGVGNLRIDDRAMRKRTSSTQRTTLSNSTFVERNRLDTTMTRRITSQTTSTSTNLASSLAAAASPVEYSKIYCDLDGVLVDFERGVMSLLQTPSSCLIKGTMWKHIARADAFYENLDWMEDGKRLWQEIRHLKPDILTGVPYPKASRIEKFNWCKRELGLSDAQHVDMAAGCRDHESVNGNFPSEDATNVITCWSNNKHLQCNGRA